MRPNRWSRPAPQAVGIVAAAARLILTAAPYVGFRSTYNQQQTSGILIIAIDGPAGSGKSTTAKEVARELGYLYLDTGAMYRAAALGFIREDQNPTEASAQRILPDLRIDLRHSDRGLQVFLNDDDVTSEIRSTAVSNLVSEVAALRPVREKLVDEQRRIAREYEKEGGGVVLDGRDIATVVFPKADVKIFMVADEGVRARRRCDELAAQGEEVAYEEVLADMKRRDERDAGRAVAPLRKAADAIEINTSDLNIAEQVSIVLAAVKERQNLSAV